MSRLGYPQADDRPEIEVRKPENPPVYESFSSYWEKQRAQDREADTLSENVARMKAEEQKRRDLSRLQQHEQHIAHLRASGVPVSTAEEERLRIIALGK